MKRLHSARRRILIHQTTDNFVAHFHIRNIYDSGWHSGGAINVMRRPKEPCLFRHGKKIRKEN